MTKDWSGVTTVTTMKHIIVGKVRQLWIKHWIVYQIGRLTGYKGTPFFSEGNNNPSHKTHTDDLGQLNNTIQKIKEKKTDQQDRWLLSPLTLEVDNNMLTHKESQDS